MSLFYRVGFILLALFTVPSVYAGILIGVEDPRYFTQHHDVIFPASEVKLVITQFESPEGDAYAREWTKKFHNRILAGIHDLHGGAIVGYIFPEGKNFQDYRAESDKIATEQHAQMVLWGRVVKDQKGTAYIKARLNLITPPPGIEAKYQAMPEVYTREEHLGRIPLVVKGVVSAPVTQRYIEFRSYENDIVPLSYFMSGLMRYYKGAVRQGQASTRWLKSSIDDFGRFISLMQNSADNATLARAHLFTARAYARLALTTQTRATKNQYLDHANEHVKKAGRYNPYSADVPLTQAVINIMQGIKPVVVHKLITKAVSLAPVSSDAWINLAIMNTAEGRIEEAKNNLNTAELITTRFSSKQSDAIANLRRQLLPHQDLEAHSPGRPEAPILTIPNH